MQTIPSITTVVNGSSFSLNLSLKIKNLNNSNNNKPHSFATPSKVLNCEIPSSAHSSSPPHLSGLCRASQLAELFPTTSPEVVVREARIEDCWEVAETHCSCIFPEYSFPLDFVLRFDRLVGMLFGFSVPKGCQRTCLVAVIGSSDEESFFIGSDEFKIGGLEGKISLNKGYVAGILTVDTVADFLPRKGPLRQRRCREKQKKESGDVASENMRLNEANKMLKEENDGLQRKLTQLISENEELRNQVLNLTSTISTYEFRHQPEANNPQLPIVLADRGLVSLAEETRKEFLCKAIGTAINWVPVPWRKLQSPVSAGMIYVPSSCIGVAARAYVTVPLEPFKIIEVFKDRTSWSRYCRNMDVIARFPANYGGTIELIYTQYYAPTMMASARDFWTLRYTSLLDDGAFVICEKSISGSDAAPSSPAALEFVRGRLLASGCMIRPSEGGSTIYLVEHADLEASSVPEVVRPLYESSEIVAKKMIVSVLNYIDNVVSEKNGLQRLDSGEEPAFQRSFSHRLSRGFNDAVNCLSEDGWALMNPDALGDVVTSIKRTKNHGVYGNFDSVICVKSSLLLQNVFPASMVRLLKERRSNWMNFDFSGHSVAFSRAACFAFPGLTTHNLSETSVFLGPTNHEDEILEIIRFDSIADHQHNASSGDLYHIQICNGMEESNFGTCSELIFAAIDRNIPDDTVLLSSGFRIYLGTSPSNLASNEVHNAGNPATMLTIAFQFPFQAHLVEEVEAMARDYVRHVISSVKKISLEAMLPVPNPETSSVEENQAMEFNITSELDFAASLVNLMCQSYRSVLGVDMLGINYQSACSVLEQMQNHPYAILCFSLAQSVPVCIYANQAGLNMLEITPDNLHALSLDRILGSSNNLSLYSVLPTIIQQGYAMLPPGTALSMINRCVSYGQAVVWQVQASDGSVSGLGFAFIDWCTTQLF